MISNKTIYLEWKQNKKVSQKCFKKNSDQTIVSIVFRFML